MRVLLDENVDRRLRRLFDPAFEIVTVAEHGWSGKKNGELLRAAEQEFDALVTMDRGIEKQQHIPSFDLGFVLIQAVSNRRADVAPAMGQVNQALLSLQAGQLLIVQA
jgi:predicted nuclease of predicted toxin-antitoxin system